MKTDVAIIGAGPAGIAAAVQLKRYGIKCLLFEKDRPGGLLKNAHRVENYPGFPRGITGPQLAELLREHLEVFRITPVIEAVEGLEYWETENCYLITTGEGVYQAKIVVSACGTAPVIPEEAENLPTAIRKNIFYEVFPIVKEEGKRILVIGAGDAAFDYALNLAGANDVIIANRGEQVKALPLLVKKVAAHSRIIYSKNTRVKGIGGGKVKELSVVLSSDGEQTGGEMDYMIYAVGREPQRFFYKPGLVERVKELKAKGLFYEIGDLVNGIFRQAAIAAGNGIQTAMKIHRWLTKTTHP